MAKATDEKKAYHYEGWYTANLTGDKAENVLSSVYVLAIDRESAYQTLADHFGSRWADTRQLSDVNSVATPKIIRRLTRQGLTVGR